MLLLYSFRKSDEIPLSGAFWFDPNTDLSLSKAPSKLKVFALALYVSLKLLGLEQT